MTSMFPEQYLERYDEGATAPDPATFKRRRIRELRALSRMARLRKAVATIKWWLVGVKSDKR